MKLIIVFTGLIAHISSGPNWWAVAVEGMNHKPQLVVRADALESKCECPCTSEDGVATIDLSDDQFTIVGLDAATKPTKSAKFDKQVPSLTDILGVKPDPEVEEGKASHAGVGAAIQLGEGTISPSNCIVTPAKWPDDETRTCLAESTVWVGDLPKSDTITLKGNKHSWTFKSGAVLAFRNERPGNHFPMYGKLAKGGKVNHAPKAAATGVCLMCEVVGFIQPSDVRTSPDLECTPTRYP